MHKEANVKLVQSLGALAFTPLLASAVPAAAKVGGAYPLTHGMYVQEGTSCKGAPNAAIRTYDGGGIGDPFGGNVGKTIGTRAADDECELEHGV